MVSSQRNDKSWGDTERVLAGGVLIEGLQKIKGNLLFISAIVKGGYLKAGKAVTIPWEELHRELLALE